MADRAAAELEALRRLLFLSQAEAASICGVADRTWRRWESGRVAVPEDALGIIRDLARWREDAIARMLDMIEQAERAHGIPAERITLVWYRSAEDFASAPGRGPDARILWRPHQSAVAAVAVSEGARLVPFDAVAYRAWLAGRPDSDAMRAEWAASAQAGWADKIVGRDTGRAVV